VSTSTASGTVLEQALGSSVYASAGWALAASGRRAPAVKDAHLAARPAPWRCQPAIKVLDIAVVGGLVSRRARRTDRQVGTRSGRLGSPLIVNKFGAPMSAECRKVVISAAPNGGQLIETGWCRSGSDRGGQSVKQHGETGDAVGSEQRQSHLGGRHTAATFHRPTGSKSPIGKLLSGIVRGNARRPCRGQSW
jgi:hypothetical protein